MILLTAFSCTDADIIHEAKSSRISFNLNDGQAFADQRSSMGFGLNANDLIVMRGDVDINSLFLHETVEDNLFDYNDEIYSRSAPVSESSFYDSFYVLGYKSNADGTSTALSKYMDNVKFSKDADSQNWIADKNYYWPGSEYNVKFFAYSPKSDSLDIIEDAQSGLPLIRYKLPQDVAKQVDLCTASTGNLSGDYNSSVGLSFQHSLSAIKFVCDSLFIPSVITSISFNGIYGAGTYALNDKSWTNLNSIGDFESDFSVDFDNVNDQEINSNDSTFMMIPQVLPEGATVEICFKDKFTNTSRSIKADISGKEWKMGKTYTYRISTSSLVIKPVFDISWSNVLKYTNSVGTDTCSVTSLASVEKEGEATQEIALPWKVEYLQKDDSGKYYEVEKPTWLTYFPESGTGSTDAYNYVIKVAQREIESEENIQNSILKKATAVSGIYDLSTNGGTTSMNTANCYLVNAPGRYSLPLVYGNAIKNGAANTSSYDTGLSNSGALNPMVNHLNVGITDPFIYNNENCNPAEAVIVWQDVEGVISNVYLSDDKHSLIFTVDEDNIAQCNAVVAVRDASANIMWSWHIWVTDHILGTDDKVVTNNADEQCVMASLNIGWREGNQITYAARKVYARFTQDISKKDTIIEVSEPEYKVCRRGNSLYYECGRKDPFLENKATYYSETYSYSHVWKQTSISNAILTPTVLYLYETWFDEKYYNLWNNYAYAGNYSLKSSIKTIYDPSPVGYCVPYKDVFSGFTFGGNSVASGYGTTFNSPYTYIQDYIDNDGVSFYCNKMLAEGVYDKSGGEIFFPQAGFYSTARTYKFYTTSVRYLTSFYNGSGVQDLAFYVSNSQLSVVPMHTYNAYISNAGPVRPIREE